MSKRTGRREFLKQVAAAGAAVRLFGATKGESQERLSFQGLVRNHPAAGELQRLFGPNGMRQDGFNPTGLSKKDYLSLIAGEIDFWKQHQDDDAGAIIDPYEHKERQYSTPAFALAAATLASEGGRKDAIGPAAKALTFSIAALVNHTTADFHADFYIPMVVHARRLLAGKVPQDVESKWTRGLSALDPEKTYRDTKASANWNIVNVSGECLRRKDGLVDAPLRAAQTAYIERCLETQQRRMTKFGMYEDPNSPLAYDAFPRLWLEDVVAEQAYDGKLRATLDEWLTLGGLSTLLILSPSGEWACGGRSAHHQWNEAEVAVICENNANRWKAAGREDLAGAFKRAAHLALESMRRWVRPTGEMWIVKNRADPEKRHGYEGYSFHSQYNLLPTAMLSLAYLRADESIAERPIPGEAGSYVFDLRDTFHKVIAAAGGTYVEIDAGADPHYNATGLLRVHRSGIPLGAFTENTTVHRAYGPKGEDKANIGAGVAWKSPQRWESLADFVNERYGDKKDWRTVRMVALTVNENAADQVRLLLLYQTSERGLHQEERGAPEDYTIAGNGVEVRSSLEQLTREWRVEFPILVSDGDKDLKVDVDGPRVRVERGGKTTVWEVLEPAGVNVELSGPRVASHNGWVRAAVGELPPGTKQVRWRVGFEG